MNTTVTNTPLEMPIDIIRRQEEMMKELRRSVTEWRAFAGEMHGKFATVEHRKTFWKWFAIGGWCLALFVAFLVAPVTVLIVAVTCAAIAATLGSALWQGYRGDEEIGVGDTQGRDGK